MKNDRLRISIDNPYIEALGRVTYVFAILEWNAVWCCERIEKNYIHTIEQEKKGKKGKTAGEIARDFLRLAGELPSGLQSACIGPANEFDRLVKLRNAILHGKPGTAATGEQRLFRDGIPWTPERINEIADEFAACSISLNSLLYNELKQSE